VALFFLVFSTLSFFLQEKIPNKLIKFFYAFTTLFEYSVFTFFISNSIVNRRFKRLIFTLSICFILFAIFYYTTANFKTLDSIPIGIESILVLIFAFYFFYEQINDPTLLFIYNDYRFWFIAGIMIYISGSFFIYIFANQIPRDERSVYLSFTYIFQGIMNVFFAIGILILGLQPKQKHHTKPKANHHYLDIT
jgi:hypothetical protein